MISVSTFPENKAAVSVVLKRKHKEITIFWLMKTHRIILTQQNYIRSKPIIMADTSSQSIPKTDTVAQTPDKSKFFQ